MTIRTFIAIEIPLELKKLLKRLQSRLQKGARGRVSWVRPEAMHLTLNFLGNIDEAALPALSESLGKAASSLSPFTLRSADLGAFPSMRAPRTLWLGLEDSRELMALKEAIDEALFKVGLEKDKKTFRAHLTLCRIRSRPDARALAPLAEALKVEKKVAFVVNAFVLYKSILAPAGARHSIIKKFPLGGH